MTTTKRNHPDELVVGLVSISDRASTGVYEDKGIPALQEWLAGALVSPWRAETRLIQDDAPTISATLAELVDVAGCDLVLTTGGTGPARRDLTAAMCVICAAIHNPPAAARAPLLQPLPALRCSLEHEDREAR